MTGGIPAKCPDSDFINLFKQYGATKVGKLLNQPTASVLRRRRNLEKALGYQIVAPDNTGRSSRVGAKHPARNMLEVKNGTVIVGSDAHLWPGELSLMWKAFVHFAKQLDDLKVCILNGDVLDFPQISRHPKIGWENYPTVQEEVEFAQDAVHDLERALPRRCAKAWNLGNHDGRFETRLATVAPEFARMAGFHLKDHFPRWEPAWATWVNDDVVVKHRFKGGIHATQNNTLWAGKTMVTGHLHSARITPVTDYNGTRYGVDTGCLADTNGQQFLDYTEDAPKNWRSAFGILTFMNGNLLAPELVTEFDSTQVQFRGKLYKI